MQEAGRRAGGACAAEVHGRCVAVHSSAASAGGAVRCSVKHVMRAVLMASRQGALVWVVASRQRCLLHGQFMRPRLPQRTGYCLHLGRCC